MQLQRRVVTTSQAASRSGQTERRESDACTTQPTGAGCSPPSNAIYSPDKTVHTACCCNASCCTAAPSPTCGANALAVVAHAVGTTLDAAAIAVQGVGFQVDLAAICHKVIVAVCESGICTQTFKAHSLNANSARVERNKRNGHVLPKLRQCSCWRQSGHTNPSHWLQPIVSLEKYLTASPQQHLQTCQALASAIVAECTGATPVAAVAAVVFVKLNVIARCAARGLRDAGAPAHLETYNFHARTEAV